MCGAIDMRRRISPHLDLEAWRYPGRGGCIILLHPPCTPTALIHHVTTQMWCSYIGMFVPDSESVLNCYDRLLLKQRLIPASTAQRPYAGMGNDKAMSRDLMRGSGRTSLVVRIPTTAHNREWFTVFAQHLWDVHCCVLVEMEQTALQIPMLLESSCSAHCPLDKRGIWFSENELQLFPQNV